MFTYLCCKFKLPHLLIFVLVIERISEGSIFFVTIDTVYHFHRLFSFNGFWGRKHYADSNEQDSQNDQTVPFCFLDWFSIHRYFPFNVVGEHLTAVRSGASSLLNLRFVALNTLKLRDPLIRRVMG